MKSLLANDQQMVEVVTTVATYNLVSRFLVALDVGDVKDVPLPEPSD